MSTLTTERIPEVYARAMQQQAAKDYEAALHTYGRILRTNPNIAEVHFQIGRILRDTDQAHRAIRHLRKAISLRAHEPAAWIVLADAVALGGLADDERDFLGSVKAAPIEPALRISLQDRFGARRHHSVAEAGGMTGAEVQSLVALLEAGDARDAERQASDVLLRHPGSAVAHNLLAAAQMKQGNQAAAELNYRAAIRIDPNYSEAHENLGGLLLSMDRRDEAMERFRKAVSLCPGSLSAILVLASMQIDAGKPEAALPLLQRMTAEHGETEDILKILARALVRLKKYDVADQVIGRLVGMQREPATADLLALWGMAKARSGKDEEAMATFDAALAKDPSSPGATSGKAQLLQTLGRFDDARALFLRSFDLDPGNGENYRQFSTSYKAKQGDPMIARMAERFEDPELSDVDRMNIGFGISKLLEDAKEYDRVFRYLNEANHLMHKSNPYDLAKRLHDVKELQDAYDAFDWKGATVPGTTGFAPIFVTGMPRSGTTLVEQIISSHSQVEGAGEVGEAAISAQRLMMTRGKARPIGAVPENEIALLGKNFETFIRSRFPDAPRITDKSIQSYMNLGLLKLAMPNARFIVVRRDPRDNLLSIYKNRFPEETHGYAYDQIDLARFYGTFVDMIEFWRARVPDWFHEVHYEDLTANPEEETRKLIAACGLAWEDACLNFHENKRKVETLSVFQVRQPITKASVKLWQHYEKDLKPMLDALREDGHVTD